MKPILLVLSLLFPALLIGCSSSEKSTSTIVKNQPVSTDVNKPKELGDWRVTLLPLQKENDFDFYQVDYNFQGELAATNVQIKLGNGVISSSTESQR